MKKLIVLGALIVSHSFITTTSYAASAKSPREMLADYTKVAKEAVFGKGASASAVKDSAIGEVKDTLLKQLELPAISTRLRPALSGKAGLERMDNLVTIIAAKKMSTELNKVDSAEAQSIEAAANASAKLLANADTFGVKTSIELNKQESVDVGAALSKIEALPTRILTEFSKSERDSYTQIIERFDTLNQSGSKRSAEDNFIQAIMDVKKVDRNKAIEIARKLKECV